MVNNFNNLIFDLDGTIINSSKEVLNCFEQAFEISNYPANKSLMTSDIIGPPLKEIVKLLAPELEDENIIHKIISNFRALYDHDENDISELYNGMKELLAKAKSSGKKIFIATLKPDKPTKRIIKQFNLDFFNGIYTIDKFGRNITKAEMISSIIETFKLQKEETVMIGDAFSDVIAAKEAGIFSIGVLWGYGNNKIKLIKSSDCVVGNIIELKSLLNL